MYSRYKRAFWMGVLIPIIQQLTGTNCISYYAPSMYESQGNLKPILTFATMFINFLATFASIFIMDKLGRKLLLIIGSIGCAIGLTLATIGYTKPEPKNEQFLSISESSFHWIFNSGVFFFMASFGLSHGPVWYLYLDFSWVYIAEVLPPEWMSYGVASSWLFTILVTISTPYFLNWISRFTFALYAGFMILVIMK